MEGEITKIQLESHGVTISAYIHNRRINENGADISQKSEVEDLKLGKIVITQEEVK